MRNIIINLEVETDLALMVLKSGLRHFLKNLLKTKVVSPINISIKEENGEIKSWP